MAEVEFHPLAISEARHARRWYARVSQKLAAQFVTEFDATIARIGANPPSYPLHLHGTRVGRVGRFPYLLTYLELSPNLIFVVAVAHARRRPGYWSRRLP